MTARRACRLYPNRNLGKGFVLNKPYQLDAIPSGMSFVALRWRRDEYGFCGLEYALRSWRNVCDLVTRGRKETYQRGLYRAVASWGLHFERDGLREMVRQASEGCNAGCSWGDIAKENFGLYRMLNIPSERDD